MSLKTTSCKHAYRFPKERKFYGTYCSKLLIDINLVSKFLARGTLRGTPKATNKQDIMHGEQARISNNERGVFV